MIDDGNGINPTERGAMHWPPPKRTSPTPGKRGAGYSSRACDGSITQPYCIASIKATDVAVNVVSSVLNRSVISIQHFTSAPTR